MSYDLKREILRLLREDEEFRLAVAGLLGVNAILEELRKLREDFNRFMQMEEERWKENNERWEENNKRWEENNKRWEQYIEELRKLREDHNKLREDFNKFIQLEEERWKENQKRWEENEKRWEENEKKWQENERKWRRFFRELGSLSNLVGDMIESEIMYFLPLWIKENLRINVSRLRRAVIDGVGEFDGYVEVDGNVIVVEAKSTLRVRDSRSFLEKINKLRNTKPGVNVIPIIAYKRNTNETRKAVELAKEGGIRVLKYHKWEYFEEI